MRILLASDSFVPNIGGVRRFTERLARGLIDRGHEVLVIAPSASMQSSMSDHEGIPVYGLPSVPSFIYGKSDRYRIAPAFLTGRDVEEAIETFAPDIIHIQTHFFIARTVLKIAKKLGIPTVATNHFMLENMVHHLHLPGEAEQIVGPIYLKHLKAFFDQFDVLTTPTRTAAGMLERISVTPPVHAISCGIDLSSFSEGKPDADAVRRFSLPDAPHFLFVGRLDKEKRIDCIIRALALLPAVSPARVIIAGSGPEETALRALATELSMESRVTFTGAVSDEELAALYRSAVCFVMPSIAELQSIATLEAMASGLPVIAADAMALPELAHHERNGYLFAPDDAEDLATRMSDILADEERRKRMAAESMKIVRSHDIVHTMRTFEELYNSVIAVTDSAHAPTRHAHAGRLASVS